MAQTGSEQHPFLGGCRATGRGCQARGADMTQQMTEEAHVCQQEAACGRGKGASQ